MNCTLKNLIKAGFLLGIVVYAVNMLFFSNAFFYYASGIWVTDILIQGRGEPSIGPGLILGLFACILTATFYCYVFCKLKAAYTRRK